MDNKQYLIESGRSVSDIDNRLAIPVNLDHAISGLVTEVGELEDALKKVAFYGADLDVRNLVEELGDLKWYYALAVREVASMLGKLPGDLDEEINQINIDKLRKRFPAEFSTSRALNRDLEAERKIIDGGVK